MMIKPYLKTLKIKVNKNIRRSSHSLSKIRVAGAGGLPLRDGIKGRRREWGVGIA